MAPAPGLAHHGSAERLGTLSAAAIHGPGVDPGEDRDWIIARRSRQLGLSDQSLPQHALDNRNGRDPFSSAGAGPCTGLERIPQSDAD
jgi:hypothetical protein